MRIAIDARALTGRFTGDRTYWRGLLRALLARDRENEYLLYTRLPLPEGEPPDAPNARRLVVPAASERAWTLWALPRALRRDRADLLHVQYTAPPAAFTPCPVVTTVHDISFRLFPEWFPPKHRILLNLTVPASMRRAARVITDTESSRRDILDAYDLPPEKVKAVLLGLPDGFGGEAGTDPGAQETARSVAKERYGLDGPFFLAVGVLQPRKNLRLLAEAFGMARARGGLKHTLALVGKAGWGTEEEALRALAARHGGPEAAQAVAFPGYVADEDLPHLYRACAAFCYPSLYEGFGFPPLEAMACSAPVLASNAPAMPEVCGGAARLLSPTDADAWADALIEIGTRPEAARELAARGPAHAARFTWDDTARRTLEVYREVLGC